MAAAELYCELLRETKLRLAYIELILQGRPKLPARLAYELCVLQLRCLCEIIALGSLVLNGDIKPPRASKSAKEGRLKQIWSADTTIKELNVIHVPFYPFLMEKIIPVKGVGIKPGEFKPLRIPFLGQKEIVSLYTKCGDHLHRGTIKKLLKDPMPNHFNFDEISEWHQKIENLLTCHVVALLEENTMLFALPEDPTQNNNPSVSFGSVKLPEGFEQKGPWRRPVRKQD